MKFNILNKILNVFLGFTILLGVSCIEDEADVIPIYVAPATQVIVKDVGNTGDASDIEVSFNKSEEDEEVLEYRVIVISTASAELIDITKASELPIENYQIISIQSSSKKFRLNQSIKSIDGEPLVKEQAYYIYVLTVSNNINTNTNRLSAPSNSFRITTKSEAAKNLLALDIGNNQNSSDFQLHFERPNDEDKVGSYRVYVVKKSEIDDFTIERATSLSSSRYIELAKTGKDQALNLPSNAIDTDGHSIKNGIPYHLIILSIEDGEKAFDKVLSKPSNEITLAHKSYVKTISGEFQAGGGLTYHPGGYLLAGNSEGYFKLRKGNGIKKITLDGTVTSLGDDLENCLGNGYDATSGLLFQTTKNGIYSIDNSGAVNLFQAPFTGFNGKNWLTYLTDLYVTGPNSMIACDCQRNEFYSLELDNVSGEVIALFQNYDDTDNFHIDCPKDIEVLNFGQIVIMNTSDNSLYWMNSAFSGGQVSPEVLVSLRSTEKFTDIVYAPFDGKIYATTTDNRIVGINIGTQVISQLAGNKDKKIMDGSLSESSFIKPIEITISANGKSLYVLDQTNSSLGKVVLREIGLVE